MQEEVQCQEKLEHQHLTMLQYTYVKGQLRFKSCNKQKCRLIMAGSPFAGTAELLLGAKKGEHAELET